MIKRLVKSSILLSLEIDYGGCVDSFKIKITKKMKIIAAQSTSLLKNNLPDIRK